MSEQGSQGTQTGLEGGWERELSGAGPCGLCEDEGRGEAGLQEGPGVGGRGGAPSGGHPRGQRCRPQRLEAGEPRGTDRAVGRRR